MATLLITLLAIYAAVLAFFFVMQSGFLFFPQPLVSNIPESAVVEEVFVTSGENVLHGWLCKAESEQPRKLIIYFGGNAEEVSHMIAEASRLGDYALLLVNYPGYGKSEGRPGQKSFFEAALAIYDYAVSRVDISPDHVVVMGRSIGTGSAVYLAAERNVRGVVLISPFESIRAVAQSKMPFLPVRLILRHPFPSKKFSRKIGAPMITFYGTHDNIIPPRHSQKLMQYWKGPARGIELPGYGHNNIFESRQMWEEIKNFLGGL